MEYRFEDNSVVLTKVPRRIKKITATRLGAILGVNTWQTPFKTWCDMLNVYKEPFEDNKFTLAGKAIEPIIINYLRDEYEFGESLVDPEMYFGNTWNEVKRKYDFYPNEKIMGGMWDSAVIDEDGKIVTIIEIKTTSRPQDWVDGVPLYYLLQGLQYGFLEGADRVLIPVAFLDDDDYAHPAKFKVKEGKNFKVYAFDTLKTTFEVDGETINIEQAIDYAKEWYEAYIKTGHSPKWDTKADVEILTALNTMRPDLDENVEIEDILSELDRLEHEIAVIREDTKLDGLEEELKNHTDSLKRLLQESLGEEGEKAEAGKWTLTKGERNSVDSDKLKADGIYDTYTKKTITYTLRKAKND